MFLTMPKGVYKIIKLDNDQYTLVNNETPYLTVPEKIYGDAVKHVTHFYNVFKHSKGSMGVLLTGPAGAGKTDYSNMIGNIALKDNLFVVLVSNLEAKKELLDLLDSLHNAVIIFDEFGKMFPIYIQESMLTMFSNASGGKKLFVLTENDKSSVSRFIRDRPGRVRYHIEFDRLDRNIIDEFCTDHNVTDEFYKELINLYDRSTVFSFDHLQALVFEHNISVEKTLPELLKILNLKSLGTSLRLNPFKIYKLVNGKEEEYVTKNNSFSLTKYDFDNGRTIYLNVHKKIPESEKREDVAFPPPILGESSIRISSKDVTKIENDLIYCKKNDFIVELEITESR